LQNPTINPFCLGYIAGLMVLHGKHQHIIAGAFTAGARAKFDF
jgi:hypothetical protein